MYYVKQPPAAGRTPKSEETMGECPFHSDDFSQFDHHAPEIRKNAEQLWQRLRGTEGLAHSDQYGGFYIVSRNADVRAAAVRHNLFSTSDGAAIPKEDRTPHIPEEIDPPLQLQFRRLLEPFLTQAQADALVPVIRRHVTERLDAFGGAQRVDFVSQFTAPFPVLLSLELFGFPKEDAALLVDLVETLINHRGTDVGRRASAGLTAYLERFLTAKAASAVSASEGIVASIALGEVEGRPLEMWEKVSMTRLLLFGGFTTVNLTMAMTMYHLAREPGLFTRLRAEPALMATAIDEFVRIASAGTYIARTVMSDTELGGTKLHTGEKLLLCYGAANRDPAIFRNPEAVMLERAPNPHLGFGFGTHRCMGASLAKVEIRVILEELLSRYEGFEPDPDQPVIWGEGETQGLKSLPLVLHARKS